MEYAGRELRTVAVDFDGTLFNGDNFPEIGEPIIETIEYVKCLKSMGCEIILWTNREGRLLEEAIAKCTEYGLEFDAINENMQWRIDLYGSDCRKVGADLYIDDRALCPKDIWITSLTHIISPLSGLNERQQEIIDRFRDKIFSGLGVPERTLNKR